MKILLISNLYPPHYVGGYELRCSQAAKYLHNAGHEVRVLTSSVQLTRSSGLDTANSSTSSAIPVERFLHYYTWDHERSGHFYNLALAKEQLAQARGFARLLDEFKPDVVNWWNLEGLTKTILAIPARRGIPDVHWIEDVWNIREYGREGENEHLSWFNFWRGDWGPQFARPFLRRALARRESALQREGIPTRPFRNEPRHVCFVSEFMRYEHIAAGLVFPATDVIYGGIAPERFYIKRAAADFHGRTLRLLYAGYVEPNRGLHTIVEALGLLRHELRESIELSVANSGLERPEPYVDAIKKRIEELGLTKNVNFLGKLRHEDMPRIYQNHHVLVFASTRKEGLPMTMLESMCAGCAVITTGSGGAAEIAEIAELPIFPKDHPLALSRLIAKLVLNRNLVFENARRGQDIVIRDFTFARTMAAFIRTLEDVAAMQREACSILAPRESSLAKVSG